LALTLAAAARKTAEVLASTLNVTATVYGTDSEGEFATTNHPEAIDEALAKQAGRFDAHVPMGYPNDADKQRILDLYLARFDVGDDFTRRRLQQTLSRDLGRLHLVPAHLQEFVKAGIKCARLARRAPEYLDFELGIEATKSIAALKPSA
jgi:SpoVK/Ycf46/Vps4 family AAA+-type ATPase